MAGLTAAGIDPGARLWLKLEIAAGMREEINQQKLTVFLAPKPSFERVIPVTILDQQVRFT